MITEVSPFSKKNESKTLSQNPWTVVILKKVLWGFATVLAEILISKFFFT